MTDPWDLTRKPPADPTLEKKDGAQKEWPRRRQDIGAVLWPSFLSAAVASVLCFAFVDPLVFDFAPESASLVLARMTGYAIGFFFFWLIAACSSFVTLYLVRTAHAADFSGRA